MEKKEKKPFFKRKWVWALIIFVVLFMAIPTEDKDEDDKTSQGEPQAEDVQTTPDPEPKTEQPEEPAEPLTETAQIEADLQKIINENYTYTTVDRFSINPNYGTEDDDSDYVALVYLTWSQKNSRDTTQEVLSMYSEDFAARVGANVPLVSEFAVFWTVPYHDESQTAMKFTYDRKDEGMYQVDQWNSFAISTFGK